MILFSFTIQISELKIDQPDLMCITWKVPIRKLEVRWNLHLNEKIVLRSHSFSSPMENRSDLETTYTLQLKDANRINKNISCACTKLLVAVFCLNRASDQLQPDNILDTIGKFLLFTQSLPSVFTVSRNSLQD